MNTLGPPPYEARIVPALHRIQHKHGYLKREELNRFSTESGIPLYRLQAVASFFPHFRLTAPPVVTLHVCRDMACHLAGAGETLQQLAPLAGERVQVEGVSCLGRCDRAVAASVSLHKTGEDRCYLGRSAAQLEEIVAQCLAGDAPKPDLDADLPYRATDWAIDPYQGRTADYAGVRKAIAIRDESLRWIADALQARLSWPADRAKAFYTDATTGQTESFDKPMLDAFRAWQSEDNWADAVLAEFEEARADLRGLGGAGIPAAQKWRDVRDAVREARRRRTDDRAFIVVNGDESEPGTFKDRELLLRAPHTIVEGVILAGLVTGASQGFIYIRHEYGEQIAACEREIRAAEQLGVCGMEARVLGRPFPVSVFTSPGGYICGEQSALIEAMSDRRAEPRNLPPKLETNGLDDRPTLVSNVETFAWAPYIWINGGAAYAALGTNGWRGKRFFSVSGDVNRPGVYEAPMGLTLRELIQGEQYCQGMIGGKKLKAFAPSGPSGGFLPARLTAATGLPRNHTKKKEWQELAKRRGFDPAATELDILDLELELNLFRALSPTQALGAGLVVYAEGRDMARQAVNAMEFFRNESCGKCVPCRLGSQKLVALGTNLLENRIDAERWKKELLPLVQELGEVMVLSSICGLGRSVPMPLRTVIDYFRDDLAKHLAAAK